MASPTKARQDAMKRAAARNLNSLASAPSAASQKAINGNTLRRVEKALSIVHDDAQPAALRLKLYAWLRELEERFARNVLNGRGDGGKSVAYPVPVKITLAVEPARREKAIHAVQVLCSAHGYGKLLAGRVWVSTDGQEDVSCL